MKDRQKRMLRLLLTSGTILRIDDIAEAFSIGKRTVSRDLDTLENWLALRGALLERKPNQGIRVITFSKDAKDLLSIINTPEAYLETLPPQVRQKLILLYLIFHNREIKISELAQTFFISDTSVWNDLNQIELEQLEEGMTLDRMKGVGLRLTGTEHRLRLAFLRVLTELFSSHTIIPYLYDMKGAAGNTLEVNQFSLLLKRIRFPNTSAPVMRQVATISQQLGYQFTMAGEALLYFYLQISIHRIKSGSLITADGFPPCLSQYYEVSKVQMHQMTDRIFSGRLPEQEISFLGLILQVLEIGDISHAEIEQYLPVIGPGVSGFLDALIDAYGKLDNELYYLDRPLREFLGLAVSSLVTRMRCGIPSWHGSWGTPLPSSWNTAQKEQVLSGLLQEHFSITAAHRDTEYLLMHFQALIQDRTTLPKHKVRALVCCFEGIGLATYLQNILQQEIPDLDVVEATAVYKIHQNYLLSKKIDLVISTYPVHHISIPAIAISLPLDRKQIEADITEAVQLIQKKMLNLHELKLPDDDAQRKALIAFNTIWNFIQQFSLVTLDAADSVEEVITALSQHLVSDADLQGHLAQDFLHREALGALYFEEYDLRVLHCKSAAVTQPHAGVITFTDETTPRIVFLSAPDPCPEPIRLMLSEVITSIMEDRFFRQAIMTGTLTMIRKGLMGIYKDLF
ncbi:MAG: HTH domain-containing protein [Spirochaetia bacterium]|nr:HTH domain-containing protein [Spirochaetia bacterium]